MDKHITISETSKRTGLSPKTIRFYEDVGLIDPAQRRSNGYRIYSREDINKLILIKNARDIGLPIEKIKKLLQGCVESNCKETRISIEANVDSYLEIITKKIEQLQSLKLKLQIFKESMILDSNQCDDNGNCNILHQLLEIQKGGE